jgi:hypothetical protein
MSWPVNGILGLRGRLLPVCCRFGKFIGFVLPTRLIRRRPEPSSHSTEVLAKLGRLIDERIIQPVKLSRISPNSIAANVLSCRGELRTQRPGSRRIAASLPSWPSVRRREVDRRREIPGDAYRNAKYSPRYCDQQRIPQPRRTPRTPRKPGTERSCPATCRSGKRWEYVLLLLDHGADLKTVPFLDVLRTWDKRIIQFFLDNVADAVTGSPFAIAFSQRIQSAVRPFVDYKHEHPELAPQLQAQGRFRAAECLRQGGSQVGEPARVGRSRSSQFRPCRRRTRSYQP